MATRRRAADVEDMRRLGIASAFLGLLLLGWPGPATAATFIAPDEARVYQMVNATRAERSLGPLVRSAALDRVARGQSARMVNEQKLFHNPDLALDLSGAGLRWLWSGENVGVGPDVAAIHEAFVASIHHYENIIRSNYDHIGVGVASNPAGGVYVTHVFAQLRASAAPPPPPVPLVATPIPPTPQPPTPPPARPAPTPGPTPAAPAPIVIEGGVVAPGPVFDVVDAEEDESHPAGLFGLGGILRRLLGL